MPQTGKCETLYATPQVEIIYMYSHVFYDLCDSSYTDVYKIMATSRNYSELEMVWKGWRENSGRRMKDKYAKFVDLSNQAIQDLNQGTYLIYIKRDMVVNVWYNYVCSSSIKVIFLYVHN